jgi:hypothetical protein
MQSEKTEHETRDRMVSEIAGKIAHRDFFMRPALRRLFSKEKKVSRFFKDLAISSAQDFATARLRDKSVQRVRFMKGGSNVFFPWSSSWRVSSSSFGDSAATSSHAQVCCNWWSR